MDDIYPIIIIGLIIIGAFLIIRDLMLWYWKINKMASHLENIEDYLAEISEKLSSTDDTKNSTSEGVVQRV